MKAFSSQPFARYALHCFVGLLALGLSGLVTLGVAQTKSKKAKTDRSEQVTQVYEPELRLIEIYKQIGAGQAKVALELATQLTRDYPNFQLGQLIYGDLLRMQTKPVATFGDVPPTIAKNGAVANLAQLREESALRIKALTERPPVGTLPNQIIGLAQRNKHLIAVDTSKARLYLFENSAQGLRLISDHYISVGLQGIDKQLEGDNKTPLGIYYLTSTPDPKGLPPLYGGGALPINYPNPYDLRRGKTGSGIWFHGSPPEQYARLPKASNGCIVLSNPDLNKIIKQVAVRTTPVIIAQQLQWVTSGSMAPERQKFEEVLGRWRAAKSKVNLPQLKSFYMEDFNNYGKNLAAWWSVNAQDIDKAAGKPYAWRDTSALIWRAEQGNKSGAPVMVVTFDETHPVTKQTATKRQYWMLQGGQGGTWKIFFEGLIAAT